MFQSKVIHWVAASLWLATSATSALADVLDDGFRSPPPEARSRVIWQWVNGNISREGITADLEAMQRVGIKGLLLHEVHFPLWPAGTVKFQSPEWWDLMKFTAQDADRLGLEFGIHNCPGWASSGGPWIKPEISMQKLVWSEKTIPGPAEIDLGKLAQPKVDPKWNYYRDVAVLAVPARTNGAAISPAEVQDLTHSKSVPIGSWRVFRFGHTTTGHKNAPAPIGGEGLECDKFSREAMTIHYRAYAEKILDTPGSLAGRTLNFVEMDSYEAGPQDWSPKFAEEFRQRRGYDLLPWLPVVAGVKLADAEKFQFDQRRTIAELYDENCYGWFAELVHERPGIKFALEPYGGAFDPLTVGGNGDLVLATFWNGLPWGLVDIPTIAGTTHTWGIPITDAEAFTGSPTETKWNQDPYSLKRLGDQAFCLGVNRFFLHSIPHQPWLNVRPGMTLWNFGTHFGRTQTWWEQSRPWFDYLARCSFLLQQGHFAADVLLLNRSAAPALPVEGVGAARTVDKTKPHASEGYLGDLCCEKALVKRASVQNGQLFFPDGQSYRLLVLPNQKTMTLEVAGKVEQLVTAGATVIGPKPETTSGVEGEAELRKIADALWDSRKIKPLKQTEALTELGLGPDFITTDKDLLWTHRRTAEADIYFLSNQQEQQRTVECAFRMIGRQPELWDAATGDKVNAVAFRDDGKMTRLPIRFDPFGSTFVVFRHAPKSNQADARNNWPEFEAVATLAETWKVNFDSAQGGPGQIAFSILEDWSQRPEKGIRYYSGTATYETTFELSTNQLNRPLWLNLGQVKNLAEVELNGNSLGVLWKPPFRCNINGQAKSGTNRLVVHITNLWPNRMIGDEQEPADIKWGNESIWNHSEPSGPVGRPMLDLPAWLSQGKPRPSAGRYTFTTWNFYQKDSRLLPSGLLGPVQIQILKQ